MLNEVDELAGLQAAVCPTGPIATVAPFCAKYVVHLVWEQAGGGWAVHERLADAVEPRLDSRKDQRQEHKKIYLLGPRNLAWGRSGTEAAPRFHGMIGRRCYQNSRIATGPVGVSSLFLLHNTI